MIGECLAVAHSADVGQGGGCRGVKGVVLLGEALHGSADHDSPDVIVHLIRDNLQAGLELSCGGWTTLMEYFL